MNKFRNVGVATEQRVCDTRLELLRERIAELGARDGKG